MVLSIINIGVICVASFGGSIIQILQGNDNPTPRLIYPMGAIVGVLLMNYFVNIYEKESKGIYLYIISGVLISLLCLQYIGFARIFIDRYKTNKLDEYRIDMIQQAIDEYEYETGKHVDTICYYPDQKWNLQYKNMFFAGDIGNSSFSTDFSIINAINYYTGRDYKVGSGNDYYREYFSNYDWDTFSYQQLKFDENELHMCVY